MADIVLIAKTKVEWSVFLGACSQLGLHPTRELDARKLPVDGNGAFVCCGAALTKVGAAPLHALRTCRSAWKLIHFTFMLHLPAEHFPSLMVLGLNVIPASTTSCLASGNLAQWHDAIEDGLRPGCHQDLKELFCKIVACFEVEDLGQVWGLLEKQHTPDKLFYWATR